MSLWLTVLRFFGFDKPKAPSFEEGWRKKREEIVRKAGTKQKATYDAYPDLSPGRQRRLAILDGRFMQLVELGGLSLPRRKSGVAKHYWELDLRNEKARKILADAILIANGRIQTRVDIEDEERRHRAYETAVAREAREHAAQ